MRSHARRTTPGLAIALAVAVALTACGQKSTDDETGAASGSSESASADLAIVPMVQIDPDGVEVESAAGGDAVDPLDRARHLRGVGARGHQRGVGGAGGKGLGDALSGGDRLGLGEELLGRVEAEAEIERSFGRYKEAVAAGEYHDPGVHPFPGH